jgi:hypothetical protein
VVHSFWESLRDGVLSLEDLTQQGQLSAAGVEVGSINTYARQVSLSLSFRAAAAAEEEAAAAAAAPTAAAQALAAKGKTKTDRVVALTIRFPASSLPSFALRGLQGQDEQGVGGALTTQLNAVSKRLSSGDSNSGDSSSSSSSSGGGDGGGTFLVEVAACLRQALLPLALRWRDQGTRGSSSSSAPSSAHGDAGGGKIGTMEGDSIVDMQQKDDAAAADMDQAELVKAAAVVDAIAYRVPCPATGGACWAANGRLVCFGKSVLVMGKTRSKEGHHSDDEDVGTTNKDSNKDSVKDGKGGLVDAQLEMKRVTSDLRPAAVPMVGSDASGDSGGGFTAEQQDLLEQEQQQQQEEEQSHQGGSVSSKKHDSSSSMTASTITITANAARSDLTQQQHHPGGNYNPQHPHLGGNENQRQQQSGGSVEDRASESLGLGLERGGGGGGGGDSSSSSSSSSSNSTLLMRSDPQRLEGGGGGSLAGGKYPQGGGGGGGGYHYPPGGGGSLAGGKYPKSLGDLLVFQLEQKEARRDSVVDKDGGFKLLSPLDGHHLGLGKEGKRSSSSSQRRHRTYNRGRSRNRSRRWEGVMDEASGAGLTEGEYESQDDDAAGDYSDSDSGSESDSVDVGDSDDDSDRGSDNDDHADGDSRSGGEGGGATGNGKLYRQTHARRLREVGVHSTSLDRLEKHLDLQQELESVTSGTGGTAAAASHSHLTVFLPLSTAPAVAAQAFSLGPVNCDTTTAPLWASGFCIDGGVSSAYDAHAREMYVFCSIAAPSCLVVSYVSVCLSLIYLLLPVCTL